MMNPSFPTTLANGLSGVFLDVGGMSWNAFAQRYGAVGDNSHNDTAALLDSAMDAMNNGGIWLLPRPPVSYRVESPIQLQPASGLSVLWGMCPGGGIAPINYVGPSGTACLTICGLARSELRGIGVNLGGEGGANQIAFDFQFTPTQNNAGYIRLDKCNVQIQSGGNHIGFRVGQGPDNGSNQPFTQFNHCSITAAHNQDGSIGWQLGGSEAYGCSMIDCVGAQLSQLLLSGAIQSILAANCAATDTTITLYDAFLFPPTGLIQFPDTGEIASYTGKSGNTLSGLARGTNGTTATAHKSGVSVKQYVPGQGVYAGTSAWSWQGGGGSNNARDFAMLAPGNCAIKPHRMENGQQFFRRSLAGEDFGGNPANVLIESAMLAEYTEPADGAGVIGLSGNVQLVMTNNFLYGSTIFDQNFLTNKGTSGKNGSVTIMGLTIPASGPFWSIANGWPVTVLGCNRTDANGRPQGTIQQLPT